MNATIHSIRPRLRLVDVSRQAAREGKLLTYVQRKGVQDVTCDLCGAPIVRGICRCPKAA